VTCARLLLLVEHVCRAVFKRGTGVAVLSEYLKSANKKVEVWLQVRRRTL
jgi:hypothetical protein